MTEPRRVGLSDGQFLANGVDEQSSLELADCCQQGLHDFAVEIIAERIYERCKRRAPGLYE